MSRAGLSERERASALHQEQAPGRDSERDRIADGAAASGTRAPTAGRRPLRQRDTSSVGRPLGLQSGTLMGGCSVYRMSGDTPW
jgi:hypothetical protein